MSEAESRPPEAAPAPPPSPEAAVPGPAPGSPAPAPGSPASSAPGGKLARRVTLRLKKEVERPDWGLRLIVFFKCLKATSLIAASLLCFWLGRKSDLHEALQNVILWFHVNPTNPHVEKVLAKLTPLQPRTLEEIGAGALVFAAFILVEAWGLHNRRVWAEWLTIVATSLLIPVEIYELYEKKSVGKLVALVINVAVVIYLARHRFLFIPGPIGRWLHATFGGPGGGGGHGGAEGGPAAGA